MYDQQQRSLDGTTAGTRKGRTSDTSKMIITLRTDKKGEASYEESSEHSSRNESERRLQ